MIDSTHHAKLPSLSPNAPEFQFKQAWSEL